MRAARNEQARARAERLVLDAVADTVAALRLPIADHADPVDYIPYVEAVAARATAALRALPPDRRAL